MASCTQHHEMFERHFETPPNRRVQDMAQAMNAAHWLVTNDEELEEALHAAEQTNGNAVVEVVTHAQDSAQEQSDYLKSFKK